MLTGSIPRPLRCCGRGLETPGRARWSLTVCGRGTVGCRHSGAALPAPLAVVLGYLDKEAVAAVVGRRGKCQPSATLAALVFEQVRRLADVRRSCHSGTTRHRPPRPRTPRAVPAPSRISVSPGLAERLRYLLEPREPAIYQLIEALDAGVLAELPAPTPPGSLTPSRPPALPVCSPTVAS